MKKASYPPVPNGTFGRGSTKTVMFFVYVLYSFSAKSYYVGLTSDLGRRLNEHNGGTNASTKKGRPWVIVHEETFETRIVAREREKYLKSAAGRRWRKQNIRPPSSTE